MRPKPHYAWIFSLAAAVLASVAVIGGILVRAQSFTFGSDGRSSKRIGQSQK